MVNKEVEILQFNNEVFDIVDKQARQQLNNIANQKIDDITLSNNVLTLLANSKTIKTITLPSTTGDGTNGREVELQKGTDYIQWRYVGDTDWNNLVALNDLRGSDGRGIVSIENTSGMDLDMEYTITYTDGTTDTFWITNGAKGEKGNKGDTGEGVVSGGTTGQILAKKSNTDYDTEWIDAPSGTGGSSEKEWTLIAHSTITDDVVSFITDKDVNENAFSCKDFKIFFKVPTLTSANNTLKFFAYTETNIEIAILQDNTFGNTREKYYRYEINQEFGGYQAIKYEANSNTIQLYATLVGTIGFPVVAVEKKFTKIKFMLSTTMNDAEFWIYGR